MDPDFNPSPGDGLWNPVPVSEPIVRQEVVGLSRKESALHLPRSTHSVCGTSGRQSDSGNEAGYRIPVTAAGSSNCESRRFREAGRRSNP